MFNKALFRQSIKSNGVMWTTITIAVCIMLACLMMISGGGNVKELREGMTRTIVQDSMDSQLKSRSINYYDILSNGLEIYSDSFDSQNPQLSQMALLSYGDSYCQQKGYEKGSTQYQEVMGLLLGAISYDSNQDSIPDFVPKTTDVNNFSMLFASNFLSTIMTSEENIDMIVEELKKYSIDKEGFIALTYINDNGESVSRYTGESGREFIYDLSISEILNFQARYSYEISLLDSMSSTYEQDKLSIKENLILEAGQGFLSSLPESVSNSLQELGTMNLFSLITGSIFFKIAGILLPIIYIIMVGNNLIAGQVDSGSMAYILSTSAKRSQIVFTQAVFLISSLFGMFAMTTITSFICYSILSITGIDISLSSLALLNLGAFVTMFAMSGISFLTSCWFNRTKYSMGIGGGVNMFFLVATILGLFGSQVLPSITRIDSLNFFNYCSIISLFDEVSILNGTTDFIWKLCILIGIGLVCYIIGAVKFKKKDLPL